MKQIIFLIALGLGICASSYSQDLPEVIAMREIEIHEEANEVIFNNYYRKWCDVLKEHSKGMSGWLMKGDRGERIDKYIFTYGFDYKAVRDYYFPTIPPADYKQFYALPQEALSKLPAGVEGTNTYTDFVVLGYADIVRPLLGEVIGVHYLDVKKKKEISFERFVTKEFNVAMHNKIPGLNLFVLKGDRGDMTGKYILVYIFDSVERRNDYIPLEGEPTKEFLDAFNQISTVFEKFKSFQNDEFSYTDYIVIY
ncbi:MAG: hypothetical protein KAH17_07625 [Bacteroidales bacterium]|nr:hypothetical protein [Bacteroidales bacterium]